MRDKKGRVDFGFLSNNVIKQSDNVINAAPRPTTDINNIPPRLRLKREKIRIYCITDKGKITCLISIAIDLNLSLF